MGQLPLGLGASGPGAAAAAAAAAVNQRSLCCCDIANGAKNEWCGIRGGVLKKVLPFFFLFRLSNLFFRYLFPQGSMLLELISDQIVVYSR